jgi:hypothetical protein
VEPVPEPAHRSGAGCCTLLLVVTSACPAGEPQTAPRAARSWCSRRRRY